jgi:cellulose synthase/poly-beta-1,6-N-acetylglucosamine synthase-like glycosyltransferase
MRNAFCVTDGELIFVLDADFAPRTDFLKETVPYFIDKQVGIVQTPQYFQVNDSDSAIQKGATFLQEVFHRLIQSFRNQWGSSVCTGSCAVYRRAALAPYGGAYPVERSEDVNTGLAVLRAGWKLKFIPLVLSAGLSPDTLQAFCNQNYRWCSGSLDLITTSLFWKQPNISIFGKLSYCLSILYYLSSGLGTIMFSLPSIINVWFFPESFAIANYSLIAPALFVCVGLRSIWSSQQWGYGVILASFVGGYTNLTSIIDVLRGNIAEWVPTGDLQATKNTDNKKTSVFSKVQKFALIIPFVNVSLFMSGLLLHWENILVSQVQVIPTVLWFSIQLWLSFAFFLEINRDIDGQEILPCLAAPKI